MSAFISWRHWISSPPQKLAAVLSASGFVSFLLYVLGLSLSLCFWCSLALDKWWMDGTYGDDTNDHDAENIEESPWTVSLRILDDIIEKTTIVNP